MAEEFANCLAGLGALLFGVLIATKPARFLHPFRNRFSDREQGFVPMIQLCGSLVTVGGLFLIVTNGLKLGGIGVGR